MRKLVLLFTIAGCVVSLQAGPGLAAAGADLKAFCKASLAVDNVDEPSKRLLERLRDTAPDEIADTVDLAVTTFLDQGEAAFEDPAFNAALAEMDQFVVDECGYETVDVAMRDYSFDGVPDRVKKGVVAFNLTNEGAELHELYIGRLKGGSTLDDLLALPEDAKEKAVKKLLQEVPGGGFAFPDDSDLALIDFKKPGKYVAVCFIPVGTTPEAGDEGGSGPPHAHEGMAVQFTVTT